LFTVAYDRDIIWQAYVNGFNEPAIKQEHTCSACRSFIRQVGAVIIVNDDLTRTTLWDLADIPEEYAASIAALKAYVNTASIVGRFYHDQPVVGVDKNTDKELHVVWEHFYVKLPAEYYDKNKDGPTKNAALLSAHDVFKRSLVDITQEAIDTVLELIGQGSLYRGNEHVTTVGKLANAKKEYIVKHAKLTEQAKDDYIWREVVTAHGSLTHVRNSAIGTLLVNLSENMDLENAVRAYEVVTAPTNYRRPTSLVTPRMVEEAKTRLTELNLISALDRRKLDSRDLKAAQALFVHRPKTENKDVFAQIAGEGVVDMKKLDRVETITIEDFIKNVLPTVTTVRVLLERKHLGNLATLTGAIDPEAKPLFKWDNSFGWSYTGGVADSIKEKVKAAGGKVEGVWLRASLAWHNYDDLDLSLTGNGIHVYFGSKVDSKTGTKLDVDMNAGGGHTREPVENIYVPRKLTAGTYRVIVNQYAKRETTGQGFDLEIEIGDQTYGFSSLTNGATGHHPAEVTLIVAADGTVAIDGKQLSKNSSSTTKWGLSTGVWQTTTAITLSPNHWTHPIGNKHYFFFLKGATSDEATRPFYNEFLVEELAKERKVMEVLGSKVKVADAEGAELSGLGFSETVRNELYVEVEGKFKRILKITF